MPRYCLLVLALALAGCDCGGDITHGASGELLVEETQINFGSTCPKPTDPSLQLDPVVTAVHLRNQGSAALYLNTFEIEAGRTDVFSFDPAAVPETLGAGESVAIPLSFQPSKPGLIAADLTIVADDGAPVVVKLMGEGLDLPPNPVLAMSCPGGKWSNDSCEGPNPNYFFVDTPVHSVGLATVTMKNEGCAPMRISALGASTEILGSEDPATFALADGQPTSFVVEGGGSAEVQVRFAPKAESSFIGALDFTSNDPENKDVSLPLRGVGIKPVLVLDPIVCDFRALPASCDGVFSVSNAGGQELVVQSVAIYNANPMFRIVSAPAAGARIAANSALTGAIQIEYVPGLQKGSDLLVVESSGGTATAELRGGSPPVLRVEPALVVDFGDNLSSTTDYYLPVRIRNVESYHRQLPLTLRSVEIDARPPSNASGAFDLSSDGSAGCPAAPAANTGLAPGEEIGACVHFKSTENGGVFTANLLVKSDDPDFPDPDGYLLSVSASTTCNPAPYAEITAPQATACPCAAGEECVGTECHRLASLLVNLSDGGVVLSGERSFDLVDDGSGACTTQDPGAIAFWEWSILSAPDGADATLSADGKGTENRTTLAFDLVGQYVVGLLTYDATGLVSPQATFRVNVDP